MERLTGTRRCIGEIADGSELFNRASSPKVRHHAGTGIDGLDAGHHAKGVLERHA